MFPISHSCQQTCKDLNIPINRNELTDHSPPWESKSLGTLIPLCPAEKKVQEYFLSKVENPENGHLGFFYKIKKGKTVGYLLGTVHDASILWKDFTLHRKVYNSFNKAASAAFENTPEQSPLPLPLSPDEMYASAKASQCMDKEFMALALIQGKTVHALEPFRFLHPQHTTTTIPIERGSLEERDYLSTVRTAFLRSSEEQLEQLLQLDSEEETQRHSLRNEKMAEKIMEHLDSPSKGRIFVAVGALHMVGEKGIPRLLSEKYEVEQVKCPSNPIDFQLTTDDTVAFIARSISRTVNQEDAPIHKEMALFNIVTTLLKKGKKRAVVQSAFSIAEKIFPSPHRNAAFLEIAKHLAQQGDIEGAFSAAFKIEERHSSRSDAFEFIANALAEQGEIERSLKVGTEHCRSPQHYPGRLALRLAEQKKFEEAILVAKSIKAPYQEHRSAAFAGIALMMARENMVANALEVVAKYIDPNLQSVVKDSIEEITTCDDVEVKLSNAFDNFPQISWLEPVPPLHQLCQFLKKQGLFLT